MQYNFWPASFPIILAKRLISYLMFVQRLRAPLSTPSAAETVAPTRVTTTRDDDNRDPSYGYGSIP